MDIQTHDSEQLNTNQQLHPFNTFPAFHANPAIRYLAANKRWTVSDINARPIDIVGLKLDGHLYGASPSRFDTSLMTLADLNAFLPDAANATYFADYTHDGGLVVFDVEKTCPPQIAAAILSWPCLYREVSKSGHGFHVIMALPAHDELIKKLAAVSVTALRAPGGVFEVLLSHWVTFTRNVVTKNKFDELVSRANAAGNAGAEDGMTIPPTHDITAPFGCVREGQTNEFGDLTVDNELAKALNSIDYSSVESTLLGLIEYRDATARTYNAASIDEEFLDDVQNLPHYNEIIDHLVSAECEYTLDDYDQDHSRFEFAMLNWLHNQFYGVANDYAVLDQYDLHAQAVVIYQALTERIDHRDKHDTTRSGMPYLLYSATRCVE